MPQKTIICLGAGYAQTPIIKAIKRKGFQAIAIDKNSEAPGFDFVDEKIICSTYDSKQVLIELGFLRDKYNYIGLIARTSGPALRTASAIAEKFNLQGLNNKIVQLATEKSKLQEFCRARGFLMPANVKIVRQKPVYNLELSFPLIVKPDLPIVGKKAVKIVDSSLTLSEAIMQASIESGNKTVEVEEYIEGIDVSCMFTVINGQVEIMALWDELVGINNDWSIKALGVSVPSVIEASPIKQKIEIIVKNFGKLFPELNAVLIMSFRVTGKGDIYIIELHADLGGDLIADILLPKANPEFNFFNMVVDFACGDYHSKNYLFRPTTLIYKPSVILPENDCQMINGNAIIQSVSLKNNFKLAKQTFPKLKILPTHEQFLL